MGVSDVARYPWMNAEIELIRAATNSGRRVLGVCLGAQLLAHALGGQVYPAPNKEIGWFEVEAVYMNDAMRPLELPERFTPLHWHGDMFELPPNAIQLARSASCPNQAFMASPKAVGLQFHIEVTPASVAALLNHCRSEIGNGPWEMKPTAILDCEANCLALRPILDRILRFLEAERSDQL